MSQISRPAVRSSAASSPSVGKRSVESWCPSSLTRPSGRMRTFSARSAPWLRPSACRATRPLKTPRLAAAAPWGERGPVFSISASASPCSWSVAYQTAPGWDHQPRTGASAGSFRRSTRRKRSAAASSAAGSGSRTSRARPPRPSGRRTFQVAPIGPSPTSSVSSGGFSSTPAILLAVFDRPGRTGSFALGPNSGNVLTHQSRVWRNPSLTFPPCDSPGSFFASASWGPGWSWQPSG